MWRTKTIATLSIIAALAGYGAFATYESYYISGELQSDLSFTAVQQLLNISNAFSYGTVISTDPANQTVTYASLDPITKTPRTIIMHITKQTVIQQETLQADASGSYVSLSPLSTGSIEDLVPGTKIAVTFVRSGGTMTATSILFGNPL